MRIRIKVKEYNAVQWFHGIPMQDVFEKDDTSCAMIAPDKNGIYGCAAYLQTEEGKYLVKEGDWIVTDDKGRKNVFSDQILRDHFEEVVE